MSTIVTCTALLCRHLIDGICSRRRIELENAEFHYRDFRLLDDAPKPCGDEQFCRSFATIPTCADDESLPDAQPIVDESRSDSVIPRTTDIPCINNKKVFCDART